MHPAQIFSSLQLIEVLGLPIITQSNQWHYSQNIHLYMFTWAYWAMYVRIFKNSLENINTHKSHTQKESVCYKNNHTLHMCEK